MKTRQIFSILFLLGALVALCVGEPTLLVVGMLGFFVSLFTWKASNFHSRSHAYLTIVPGIITAPRPDRMQSMGVEEVPPMTRAEKALYDYLRTKSNAVTYQAIREGAISFDPVSYFIRYSITGLSGRQTILGPSTLYSIGVTNFPNQAVLPQYYNFCFDRIIIRYVNTTAADSAVNSSAGYSSVATAMDPALRNGNIIIKSNRNAIVETPVIDFASAAAVTGGGSRDYDGGMLEKPRFFLEQLQIETEIEFAGTVASATNNSYLLEVVFCGVQARLKY